MPVTTREQALGLGLTWRSASILMVVALTGIAVLAPVPSVAGLPLVPPFASRFR